MQVGVSEVIASIVLVVGGSIGYIVANESSRERYSGLVMFMGAKGRSFLNLMGIVALLIYIAVSVYLLVTSGIWALLGALLISICLGPIFSGIVLRVVIHPVFEA